MSAPTDRPDRTVWLAKDTLRGLALMLPIWGVAGLVWGLIMSVVMGGSMVVWLIAGLLWGGGMWLVFCAVLAFTCREITAAVPLADAAALPGLLGEALGPLGYAVEQQSPASLVCHPKNFIARALAFQYVKLHVNVSHGHAELAGPAMAVNAVRKKLVAVPAPGA